MNLNCHKVVQQNVPVPLCLKKKTFHLHEHENSKFCFCFFKHILYTKQLTVFHDWKLKHHESKKTVLKVLPSPVHHNKAQSAGLTQPLLYNSLYLHMFLYSLAEKLMQQDPLTTGNLSPSVFSDCPWYGPFLLRKCPINTLWGGCVSSACYKTWRK